MVKLSQEKFRSLLQGVSATQFVGFTAITVPELVAKGNPYRGRVVKIARVSGSINWKYERAVRRQLEREGHSKVSANQFDAKPRIWGNRVSGCPLVLHCTDDGPKLFVEVKVERTLSGYYDTDTLNQIPDAEIQPFEKARAPSRQRTEREIVLRDYDLSHIAEWRMSKIDYRIEPLWMSLAAYLPDSKKEFVA